MNQVIILNLINLLNLAEGRWGVEEVEVEVEGGKELFLRGT